MSSSTNPTHTPAPSTSNAAAGTTSVVPSSNNLVPVVGNPSLLPASFVGSAPADTPYFYQCSALSDAIEPHTLGPSLYAFRDHPRVATFLQIFAVVELVEVRAFIYQTEVLAATTKKSGNGLALYRFGIVPRALTFGTSSPAENYVSSIPRLVPFAASTTVANTATYSWSASGSGGAERFPPGIQLDYRAVETRFNYAQFCIGAAVTAKDADSGIAVRCQLDFVVKCSGQGFGALH